MNRLEQLREALSDALFAELLANVPPGFRALPDPELVTEANAVLDALEAERRRLARFALNHQAATFDGALTPGLLALLSVPAELELLRGARAALRLPLP